MSEQLAQRALVKKLAQVMKAVERIPKNGYNEHFKYSFAREADIVEAIRKELADRNVMLLPGITAASRTEVGKTGSGAVKALTLLKMTFTFIDGDSGEEIERPWQGAGIDTEDKGTYKAMTGAEKYFLLKTFLIPTGDDPEAEADERSQQRQGPRDGRSRPPQPVRPPAPSRQPARPAVAAPAAQAPAAAPVTPAAPAAADKLADTMTSELPVTVGPVTIVAATPHSRGDKNWLEVSLSSGVVAIATTAKAMHDVTAFAQKKTQVKVALSQNAKGKQQIDSIAAWPAKKA